MEVFNYVVGYLCDNGRISCYAYGGEVQYGTQSDAETFLSYVKRQSPDKDWQIFKIDI